MFKSGFKELKFRLGAIVQ